MTSSRWRYILRLRLRSAFRRSRVEDDLADEIAFHVEERARELIAQGMTAEAARVAAVRGFGGIEQRKEECRDARRMMWLDDLRRDVTYGLRMIRRAPGFTSVAVLSLALGIGANTVMFSVFDALLVKTLRVAKPAQLVLIDSNFGISHAAFLNLQERAQIYSSIAAVWTFDRSNVVVAAAGGERGSEGSDARIGLASAGYFHTLGVAPAIGRTFADDENRTTGRAVAVISDDYWRKAFARTPDILGRTLRLHGVAYDIIGVTPEGFSGEWVGMPTDVWVPFAMASQAMPEVPGGPARFPRRVIARLAAGVTLAEAQAATEVLHHQFLRESAASLGGNPSTDQIGTRVTVESAVRGYSPARMTFVQPLAILAAGVSLLLLITCANLANLLLARAAARQRELCLRLAIGAGRARLVRQMLTESLLLAALGGVLAVVVALWFGNILAAMMAAAPVSMTGDGMGLFLPIAFDARVLAFSAAICILTGVLIGSAPAFSASRVRLAGSLNQSSSRVVGPGRFGPSTLLVVFQVTLSLLMLVGAGLFIRTLSNLKAQDLGFERERELLVWTAPGQTGRLDATLADLWHTIQERLSGLPGVISVGASNQAVLRGSDIQPGSPATPMWVEGESVRQTIAPGLRSFVTPRFFETLGIPIVAGRDFTERDTETAPAVVIVNESMARYYFGDRPAVGMFVRFPGPRKKSPTQIVGVVGDFVKGTPRGGMHAEFATYFPYRDPEALNRGAQSRLRVMMIAIRTAGDPLALARSVRAELRAIDPELPVLRINTPDQQLDDVLAQDRLIAVLSSAFGAIAVFLSCLGVFGLISHRVTRRTNEIGVRLALGASRRGIFAMILTESGRLVAAGLIFGIVAATWLARLVASRLFGVSAFDPLTLTMSIGILVVVAALAAFIPARRAASIDPMQALRSE